MDHIAVTKAQVYRNPINHGMPHSGGTFDSSFEQPFSDSLENSGVMDGSSLDDSSYSSAPQFDDSYTDPSMHTGDSSYLGLSDPKTHDTGSTTVKFSDVAKSCCRLVNSPA